MKTKPTTAGEWIAWVLAFVVIQSSTMYVCLRMLHWNFLLSAVLAAGLGVGGAVLAVTALSARSAG